MPQVGLCLWVQWKKHNNKTEAARIEAAMAAVGRQSRCDLRVATNGVPTCSFPCNVPRRVNSICSCHCGRITRLALWYRIVSSMVCVWEYVFGKSNSEDHRQLTYPHDGRETSLTDAEVTKARVVRELLV